MIDKKINLTIKHDDNTSFTDYTHKMCTFGRDSVTLDFTTSEDYIYVGYTKPINSMYIEITSSTSIESDMTLEYWNGSSYVTVSNLSDDTFGLDRSGFVRWDRESSNQQENTVDGLELFWYRLNSGVDRLALTFSGINIVFSDDYELSLEQPYISDPEFLGNQSSHIKTHAAVRNEIVQKFRNKNYIKIDNQTGDIRDINAWDLLEIDEVKLAASYLALSKIYFQLSDNPEDVWGSKSVVYAEKFTKFINIARLSIDTNDDGLKDDVENKRPFKNRYFGR